MSHYFPVNTGAIYSLKRKFSGTGPTSMSYGRASFADALRRYGRNALSRTTGSRKRKRIGGFDVGVRSGGPQTFLRLPRGYGFPDRYIANDTIYYECKLTAAAGKVDTVMYANSIYQVAPDNSNTRNYAALAAVYRKYKVLASAIRVTLVNNDVNVPVLCSVTPSEDAAAIVVYNVATTPLSRSTVVTQYAGKEIIHHYCNLKKLVGKNILDNAYGADFGARPTSLVAWYVQVFGDTATPTALDCHLAIFVTQTVEFRSRETS